MGEDLGEVGGREEYNEKHYMKTLKIEEDIETH